MTISYPLAMPVHTGIAGVSFRMVNTTALSESPFTGKQQLQAYARQRWEADITLPSMLRADAEEWTAWLSSLRGRYGTFLLGDPMGIDARGSARGSAVNQLEWTEDLSNAVWVKSAGWTATAAGGGVFDPAGGTTAWTIQSGSAGQITQTQIATSSGTQTYRFWVRYGNMAAPTVTFYVRNTTTATNLVTATVTFSTMAVAFAGANGTGSFAYNGNGWTQVTITVTSGITVGDTLTIYAGSTAVTGLTYHVWHPQYEIGGPTTYQAIAASYAPAVNGASQTGNTLAIKGASPSQIGFLMPGDYIQLGTTANARLFKVLTRVDTDASGNGSVDIWPNLRASPADGDPVVVNGAKGLFRLMSDESSWNTNAASVYGVSFTAMEAY